MIIKYFAYIRDFTREKGTTWDESADDLQELLQQLSHHYGKKFREAVFNETEDDLNDLIIILVNGRHVAHLDGIHTKLKSDDQVSIFPVVAGG